MNTKFSTYNLFSVKINGAKLYHIPHNFNEKYF